MCQWLDTIAEEHLDSSQKQAVPSEQNSSLPQLEEVEQDERRDEGQAVNLPMYLLQIPEDFEAGRLPIRTLQLPKASPPMPMPAFLQRPGNRPAKQVDEKLERPEIQVKRDSIKQAEQGQSRMQRSPLRLRNSKNEADCFLTLEDGPSSPVVQLPVSDCEEPKKPDPPPQSFRPLLPLPEVIAQKLQAVDAAPNDVLSDRQGRKEVAGTLKALQPFRTPAAKAFPQEQPEVNTRKSVPGRSCKASGKGPADREDVSKAAHGLQRNSTWHPELACQVPRSMQRTRSVSPGSQIQAILPLQSKSVRKLVVGAMADARSTRCAGNAVDKDDDSKGQPCPGNSEPVARSAVKSVSSSQRGKSARLVRTAQSPVRFSSPLREDNGKSPGRPGSPLKDASCKTAGRSMSPSKPTRRSDSVCLSLGLPPRRAERSPSPKRVVIPEQADGSMGGFDVAMAKLQETLTFLRGDMTESEAASPDSPSASLGSAIHTFGAPPGQ